MKKKEIFAGIFLILVVLISFYFDSAIVQSVAKIRGDFFDKILLGITFMSSKVIILFFLTSLFLFKEHKRKWIFPLWFTLCLSAVGSFVLKFSIQRPRPFQLGLVSLMPALEKANQLIWNFSFPSSHSMLAFCAVPLLSKEFPKLKYVWISFACLVALSRVYFGLHFLSDVIAGGLIGYLLGWLVIKAEQKYKFGEKAWKIIFGK